MSKTSYRILTISGPSGAGKTTLVGLLLKHFGQRAEPMLRFTTRSARADDNKGECIYVSLEEFKVLEERGELLYPIELNTWWHAMSKVQVDNAMKLQKTFLIADMSVVSVEKLHVYIDREQVLSIFLTDCPEDMLRERMKSRGEFDIEQRIHDGRSWQTKAKASNIPFVFIDARLSANIVLEEVLKILQLNVGDHP